MFYYMEELVICCLFQPHQRPANEQTWALFHTRHELTRSLENRHLLQGSRSPKPFPHHPPPINLPSKKETPPPTFTGSKGREKPPRHLFLQPEKNSRTRALFALSCWAQNSPQISSNIPHKPILKQQKIYFNIFRNMLIFLFHQSLLIIFDNIR